MHTSSDILGHPKGLFVCFATEMWERFSYYGMRALLILYLTKHWEFSDAASYLIYGAYTSLVYIMPVFGGMLADQILGSKKAVTYGAILLVFGHLGMTVESNEQIFYLSLALIVSGVGFLKPNISTMVGALYEEGDPRRDSGFTIFYMGINIGAFTATLLCGYLGEEIGWAWGFGAAGIGMLVGLIIFLWGQKYLEGLAEPPSEKYKEKKEPLKYESSNHNPDFFTLSHGQIKIPNNQDTILDFFSKLNVNIRFDVKENNSVFMNSPQRIIGRANNLNLTFKLQQMDQEYIDAIESEKEIKEQESNDSGKIS